MQEVAKSKGIMDSYRAKLQAQYEIEYQKALQSELNKIKKVEPKYIKNDTMDDYLAYIRNNNIKPEYETITKSNLKISSKPYGYSVGEYRHELWDINDNKYVGIGVVEEGKCYGRGYSCAAFAKIFKELIDKSAFKDEIYEILPQPKNK